MPIYRNNNPELGRYVVSPDGRIVYHEASQKTKAGWREAEAADIEAAPVEQLVKCGHTPAPPVEDKGPPFDLSALVSVKATGTVG